MALLLASACASPHPAASPAAALFSVLDRFADARALTPPAVAGAFRARILSNNDGLTLYASAQPPGLPRLDSLELSRSGNTAELDLFPGADCITRREAEAALGPGVRATPIQDGGFELAALRPARPSRDWPSSTYRLSAAFSGAGRCATQITVLHVKAS